MPKRISILLALIVLLGLVAWPAQAQTPSPNQVDAVAKDLWCPLCNGVRLDNCELQACVQMREVISQKLAAGEDKNQIKAYFVQQYGDVVLGAPANEGFNRLVWILPYAIGILALAWLAFIVRSWLRRSNAPQPGAAGPTPAAHVKDEYEERVDEELERYK
jgi:cytochrome c-type biogenesis protein CcmH